MTSIVARPWIAVTVTSSLIVALALVAVLLGRGGIATHGPVVSNERPWFVLSDGGDDAKVQGVLELSHDCLLLSGQAVVWPSGTRWNADRNELHLRGDAVAHLGDLIVGGGGYYGDEGWSTSDAGIATAHCRSASTQVMVFNRSDEPEVDDDP